MAVTEIINPLARLDYVKELGLAMIPDLQSSNSVYLDRSALGTCFDVVRQHIPQLRLIEVQWEACELKAEGLAPLPKHHTLMRRMWRYPHPDRF